MSEKKGMNVEIPHETLQAIIQESVTSGITKGVSSWEVQDTIRQAGEEAMLAADLPALVAAEMGRIFAERAGEIATATASGIVHALEAASVDIAATLAGKMHAGLAEPARYETTEDRKERERDAIQAARKAIEAALAKGK